MVIAVAAGYSCVSIIELKENKNLTRKDNVFPELVVTDPEFQCSILKMADICHRDKHRMIAAAIT